MRAALPEKESVQASEEVCEVDNAWLHAELEEFKTLTPAERATRLRELIDRLKALEAASRVRAKTTQRERQ